MRIIIFIYIILLSFQCFSDNSLSPVSQTKGDNIRKLIFEYLLSNEKFDPNQLLNILKNVPQLRDYFPKSVGVWEGYSLEQHTFMVINQFEIYFSNIKLPGIISHNFFRLLLSLHDSGKPKAIAEYNRSLEHQHTIELIKSIRDDLPFSEDAIDVANAIIQEDIIGLYIRGRLNLSDAKAKIQYLAKTLKISPSTFFKLLTIFYQCDAGSYTADAGGLASLEFLFRYNQGKKVFDVDKNRLIFSNDIEIKFELLETEFESQKGANQSLELILHSLREFQESSA